MFDFSAQRKIFLALWNLSCTFATSPDQIAAVYSKLNAGTLVATSRALMLMHFRKSFHFILIVASLLLFNACGPVRPTLFQAATPHARYADGLRSANLDATALGKAWQEAARLALTDSVLIAPPFAETIYFPNDQAIALGYRMRPVRGQRVQVSVSGSDSASARVFVDVFELRDGDIKLRDVISAQDNLEVEWVAERDRTYIIRVQPELLRSARCTITIRAGASIGFPVEGHNSGHIKSFFGNARDQGRRKHEGVDVFAKRGTPAIAVSDGWASASTNNLGGKVVWLRSGEQTYYYAHLDSQYVGSLRQVRTGDTLGTVGNTGNAAHTPPHLHFGIYASGEGAVDPYPFLHTPTNAVPLLKADTTFLSQALRVGNREVELRLAPDAKAPVIMRLPKEQALHPLSASGDWYRVRHRGISGYVHSTRINDTDKALRTLELPEGSALHDAAEIAAPIKLILNEANSIEVLAQDDGFLLVRSGDVEGWVLPK
jgi:murein DD-endopeptidase MepM/ murein hydrolase activator NlpD